MSSGLPRNTPLGEQSTLGLPPSCERPRSGRAGCNETGRLVSNRVAEYDKVCISGICPKHSLYIYKKKNKHRDDNCILTTKFFGVICGELG